MGHFSQASRAESVAEMTKPRYGCTGIARSRMYSKDNESYMVQDELQGNIFSSDSLVVGEESSRLFKGYGHGMLAWFRCVRSFVHLQFREEGSDLRLGSGSGSDS